MRNPRIDESAYLLASLLPRSEANMPGSIESMVKGIEADRAAVPEESADKEHIDAIFDEALSFLRG